MASMTSKFPLSTMNPSMVDTKISIVSMAVPLGLLLCLYQSGLFSGCLSHQSLSLWPILSQKLHLILPFTIGRFLRWFFQQSTSLWPYLPQWMQFPLNWSTSANAISLSSSASYLIFMSVLCPVIRYYHEFLRCPWYGVWSFCYASSHGYND